MPPVERLKGIIVASRRFQPFGVTTTVIPEEHTKEISGIIDGEVREVSEMSQDKIVQGSNGEKEID